MTELEKKKLEKELYQVKGARLELEYKIMEREQEIVRLREHVAIQLEKEKDLESQFNK